MVLIEQIEEIVSKSTVVQYCLDMVEALREISRVTRTNARIVLVIGHQSTVMGVPFYNADIIEKIVIRSGLFTKVMRQTRKFKNKFGKIIREDIINFINLDNAYSQQSLEKIAREVAFDILHNSCSIVVPKYLELLKSAIAQVQDIQQTVRFNENYDIYEHIHL